MPQRQGTNAVGNHDAYNHVINRVKFPLEELRNTAMKCRISGFPANVQLWELRNRTGSQYATFGANIQRQKVVVAS